MEQSTRRSVGDRGRHVVGPLDGRRIASGRVRGLVDPRVHRNQVTRLRVSERRRHPAVRQAPGEGERPRPADAEPDSDLLGRLRPWVDTGELVEPAIKAHSALAGPHDADDLDCLLQREHRLSARSPGPTHRNDRIPEGARTETQLDPFAIRAVCMAMAVSSVQVSWNAAASTDPHQG